MSLLKQLVMLITAWSVLAVPAFAEVSGFAGFDHIEKTDINVRYLPAYKKPEYNQTSGFIRLTNEVDLGSKNRINIAISSDSDSSFKVDKLEFDTKLDYHFLKNAGLRFGILPYRVSWCQKYEADSIWIQDPDVFCKQKTLREMSASGVGIQYYRSFFPDNYIVDTQYSMYKPTIYGEETMAVYVPTGKSTQHSKVGFSINALDLKTASQYRLGFLKTWQYMTGPERDYQFDYNTLFLGVESVHGNMRVRTTMATYYGIQTNPTEAFTFSAQSKTVELEYHCGRHRYGVGFNQYINTTDYSAAIIDQKIKINAFTASYRYKVTEKQSILTQYGTSAEALQLSESLTAPTGTLTKKSGNYLMMRYLITF